MYVYICIICFIIYNKVYIRIYTQIINIIYNKVYIYSKYICIYVETSLHTHMYKYICT